MAPSKDDKILIIGAGCFGISTAYHLLKRGFTNVGPSRLLPFLMQASLHTGIQSLTRPASDHRTGKIRRATRR